MKKRLLGILVAVAMMICAIPMTASAESTPKVKILDGEDHYLEIDANTTASGSIGGGTYSYEDGVLTLTNVEINGTAVDYGSENPAIEPKHIDLTVKIEGTCKFSGTYYGIFSEYNDLTVTGSGTLIIENVDGGLDSNGDMIIDGVTINATNVASHAISANNITFNGACNAALTSEKSTINAIGEITFNLTEGGKVDATTISGNAAVYTDAPDTIIIAENNRVTTPVNGDKYKDPATGDWYIANADKTPATHAVIEGPEATTPATATKAGANTGDSNDIALFAIMGILALCGAGFVYKKREN